MGKSGEKKKASRAKKTNKWRTMHQHNFDRIFWQWLAIVISFYLMWHWLHYLSAYTEQECITISIAIFNVIYKDYVCIRVAGIVDFSPPHTNRACFWYFFFLSSHRITTLKGSVHLSYIFFLLREYHSSIYGMDYVRNIFICIDCYWPREREKKRFIHAFIGIPYTDGFFCFVFHITQINEMINLCHRFTEIYM